MIITIDGPAAVGKSTVARQVARKLGFTHFDTGAMYRALTWSLIEAGSDVSAERAVAHLNAIDISFSGEQIGRRVYVDGREVTEDIRHPRVDAAVSAVAQIEEVRRIMVGRQRLLATNGSFVVEGRDAGSVIFPDAQVKVFLTASVRERARRRQGDFAAADKMMSQEVVERELAARDRVDSGRAVDPLVKAPDAHVIDTTTKNVREVVSTVLRLAGERGAKSARRGSA
ncbi:MAG: (d)CMP kinase [Terriglobia bacterium]